MGGGKGGEGGYFFMRESRTFLSLLLSLSYLKLILALGGK